MQHKVWLSVLAGCLVGLLLIARAQAQKAPGDVYTETVAGKEYRVAPGEKAGTWQVSYGDDKLLWEPLPWMDDELVKEGPKLYLRWAKPGLPYPWELGVEERVKLAQSNVRELPDRFKASTIFFAFGKSFADAVFLTLVSADGFERKKVLLEWGQSYVPEGNNWETLAGGEKGVVSRKYLYGYREPNEVRGLGGRTLNFIAHDRRPDEWLYLPSVRKVRRLSSAASQDYLTGTILHFDQLSHLQALPDLDYKLLGVQLCRGLGPGSYGFRPEDAKTLYTWPDGTPQKTVDGVGDVCFVVETTPKPGISWWYTRLVSYYAIHLGYFVHEEAFNEKGDKTQTFQLRPILPPPDLRQKLPYYLHYGLGFIHELSSGFKNDFWQEEILWDAEFPSWLFNQDTLLREPTTLIFW